MFVLLLLSICASVSVERLAHSGLNPPQLMHSSSEYHSALNRIIIFGGQTRDRSIYSSSLYYFDINSLNWGQYLESSNEKPSELSHTLLFLSQSEKLYVMFGKTSKGISDKIYSFNLTKMIWEQVSLSGEKMQASMGSASCRFIYKGINYLGVFGGITNSGLSNILYLINTETLTVKQLKASGNIPSARAFASLTFYEDCLYLLGGSYEQGHLFYKLDLQSETWTEMSETLEFLIESHSAVVYRDFLYVSFGHNSTHRNQNIYKYSFKGFEWILVKNFSLELNGFTFLVLNNLIYFLLGVSGSNSNWVTTFDMDTNLMNDFNNFVSRPIPRKNHMSFAYEHSLYIYGGSDENKGCLNDIWKFDVLKESWSEARSVGNIPKSRELMACLDLIGYGFVCMGGICEGQPLNENHFYSFDYSTWYINSVSSGSLPPRHSMCIVEYGFYIIVIGGKDSTKAFGDKIIMYHYPLARYIEIQSNKPLPKELVNHQCFISREENNTYIYIVGATDSNYNPYSKIFKIIVKFDTNDIQNTYYELNNTYDFSELNIYKSSSILVENSILILGGIIFGGEISKKLMIFNIKEHSLTSIQLPSELWVHSHSMNWIGNSLYVFGGVASSLGYDVSDVPNNSLLKVNLEESDSYSLPCFDGVFNQRNICEPCPAGTYLNNKNCTKCDPGLYFQKVGAIINSQCLPCKFGEFNEKPGATYCKQCPSLSSCPIGSSAPKVIKAKLQSKSEQPKNYNKKIASTNSLALNFFFTSLGIIGLIIVFCLCFTGMRKILTKLDIFTSSHEQKLEKPIILKKTLPGGFFSVSFYIFAASSIIIAFFTYTNDNITEIKTLVPLVTLNEEVNAKSLDMKIIFHSHSEFCSDPSVKKTNCISNFFYSSSIQEEPSYTCEDVEGDCVISLKFTDFQLNGDHQIKLLTGKATTYCGFISANLSVSSSIPEDKSKVFVPLYPLKEEEVFKGLKSSSFNFEFIPSVPDKQVFKSESSHFPKNSSGYHILDLKNHQIGSTLTQETFRSEASISIVLNLKLSTTALVTKRNLDNNPLNFTENLLASVFGLMGTFGAFLSCFEVIYGKFSFSRRGKVRPSTIHHFKKKNFNSYELSEVRKEKTTDFTSDS